MGISDDGNNKIEFYVFGDVDKGIRGGKTINDGQWHYVACIRSSGTLYIYVDGISDASSVSGAGGSTTSNAALNIGSTGSTNFFKGTIDELHISKIARSASEISNNWNSGNGKELTVDSNTVALWHLNDGTGATAKDEKGAHDGTLKPLYPSDSPTWVNGFSDGGSQTTTSNYALDFDGSNDNLQIPNSPDFNLGDFTFEFWIKTSTAQASTRILYRDAWVTKDRGYFVGISDNGNNKIEFYVFGDVDKGIRGGKTINDGQWHYIACIRSSGTLYIYVDGISDASSVSGAGGSTTSNAALNIGSTGSTNFFKGTIDELHISKIARSASEISNNWNSGNGKELTVDSNTVALWHLNDGTGATAKDEKGAHDGTLKPLYPSNSPTWVNGFSDGGSQTTPSPTPAPSPTPSGDGIADGSWLHTNGIFINNQAGQKINLYSINLQYGEGTGVYLDDIQKVKSYGFNTIRIHLYWGLLQPYNESPNGIDTSYFNTAKAPLKNSIDNVINWAAQNNMYVQLCLIWTTTYPTPQWAFPGITDDNQKYTSLFSGSAVKERTGFNNLWKFIANRYTNTSNVIFEILNEPYVSDKTLAGQPYANFNAQVISSIESVETQSHLKIVELLHDSIGWSEILNTAQDINKPNMLWATHRYDPMYNWDPSASYYHDSFTWNGQYFPEGWGNSTTYVASRIIIPATKIHSWNKPWIDTEFSKPVTQNGWDLWFNTVLTTNKENDITGWSLYCYNRNINFQPGYNINNQNTRQQIMSKLTPYMT